MQSGRFRLRAEITEIVIGLTMRFTFAMPFQEQHRAFTLPAQALQGVGQTLFIQPGKPLAPPLVFQRKFPFPLDTQCSCLCGVVSGLTKPSAISGL